jgi:flagellar hook-associated protein 2
MHFDVTVNGVTTGYDFTNFTAADDINTLKTNLNKFFSDEGVNMSVDVSGGKLTLLNNDADDEITVSGNGMDALKMPSSSATMSGSNFYSDLGLPANGGSTVLNTKSTLEQVFGTTGSMSFKINGKSYTMDSTYTVERMMNLVNGADSGVKMSYDSLRGSFSLESTEAGARHAIKFEDTDGFLFGANGLGLTLSESAKDAIITLNGVSTTRESNNFTIEGMDISISEDALGKEFSVSVKEDTSKTLEFVRNFVDEYNKLVDTIHSSYDTPRPKSDKYTFYEPLSDDEKDAMKEKDVEKYEAKAKEGLLYRDPILSGIGASMRSMLYESLTLEDGSKISLYEIGITTEDFSSGGTGGYGRIELDEDKLTKALSERGEDVISLFTQASEVGYSDKYNRGERRATEGIAYRIEDILKDAISTTSGTLTAKAGIEKTRSATDNEMYRLIAQQDQKISDMLEMLAKKEDNYFAMFSKLETAMTQANNQMASVQSLFGGTGM